MLTSAMRILHVVPTLAVRDGGVSRAVATLAGAAIRQGHRVAIVTTCQSGERTHRIPGASLHLFHPEWPRPWCFSRTLRPMLRQVIAGSDLVHIHGLWLYPGLLAASLSRSLGVPYVMAPHGMLDAWALRQSPIRKRIYWFLFERRNLHGAALLHAVSPDERESLVREGVNHPIVFVPNGYVPADLGIRGGDGSGSSIRDLIVYFGRLHPKKGVDLLCRAFMLLAASRPRARLAIIGPDESGMRSELEKELDAAGLRERYMFTGLQHGVERFRLLRRAAVSVLPSYSEGLPTSVIETMALGVPMVVTRGCHLPGSLARCATMIGEPTVSAIRVAVERVLRNPVRAHRLARKGMKLVRTSFSQEAVGSALQAAYTGMLQRSQAAGRPRGDRGGAAMFSGTLG